MPVEDRSRRRGLELHLEPALAEKLLGSKVPEKRGLSLDAALTLVQILVSVGALGGALLYCSDDIEIKRLQVHLQRQQVDLNTLDIQSKGNARIELKADLSLSRLLEKDRYAVRFFWPFRITDLCRYSSRKTKCRCILVIPL